MDLIAETAEFPSWKRIIWDTAPAGETLALLDMPRALRRHLKAGARFYQELDRVSRRLSGKRAIADILDGWMERSEELAGFLNRRAAFIIVSLPEPLVVAQTDRILEGMRRQNLQVAGLVVNRSVAGKQEEMWVGRLESLAGDLPVAYLELTRQCWNSSLRMHTCSAGCAWHARKSLSRGCRRGFVG